MSLKRAFMVMWKDLRMGPRSSVFMFAILMPFMIAFLMQVVFVTLFDPAPRLAIADLGDSEITVAVQDIEGIDLTLVDSADELLELVEANDADAGVILPAGFDESVRNGEKPELGFHLSGESLASNRIILSVTALDLVREVEGKSAPVEVVTSMAGDPQLPIQDRLVPMIVVYALLVAGIFVTAFMIVEEKEAKTLDAILVTPTKMSEFLLGKGMLGFLMGIVLAYLTLALTGYVGEAFVALMAPLAVGALMCVEIGLIFGTFAKDANTVFALVKSLSMLIIGPVLFYMFPSWPEWIAKIFPSYWFIDPIFEISVKGTALGEVAGSLLIALAICAALIPVIYWFGRKSLASIGAA